MSNLPSLFRKALQAASQAYDLPTADYHTQALIQSSLADLTVLRSRIAALSLFSPNESLDDIATQDIIYLIAPYVHAQVLERVRILDREARLVSLTEGRSLLSRFIESLDAYEVVPEDDRLLYKQNASAIADPTRRRELKIKQYQKEKELRTRINEITKKRRSAEAESTFEFSLIASLLPSPTSTTEDEDEDDATSEVVRDATILLLKLAYAQANTQLERMNQELELLRMAPPPPPQPSPSSIDPRRVQNESDNSWRLDTPRSPSGPDGKGPLIDSDGRPLRPFTILPAGASNRERLQAQVFRPDHRLPTMTIEEYLQIEEERGNILTGGGPASVAAPTSSEQLALDSEQDGTLFGEDKSEQKRKKEEEWALFTEENPKGAGNRMNRG